MPSTTTLAITAATAPGRRRRRSNWLWNRNGRAIQHLLDPTDDLVICRLGIREPK